MFQKHEIVGPRIWQYISGPVELSYTRYSYIGLKCTIEYLKYIFKFCTLVGHAQIS